MRILCPTDFSAHAQVALNYAINLSNSLNAELYILAVYQVPKSSTSLVPLDNLIRKNTEEDMEQLLAGIGPLTQTDSSPIVAVLKGPTVNTILQYSKQNSINLLVMGTQGEGSISNILFGSTTKAVANKTSIPVLAIPDSMQYTVAANRMVLAVDDQAIDNEEIFQVPIEIAKQLQMKIDILHIEKVETVIPFDPAISIYLGSQLGDVHLKRGTDPVAEIKQYTDNENLSMLIMIRREKSFLEKLLDIRNTSAELAKTKVPLLILPE